MADAVLEAVGPFDGLDAAFSNGAVSAAAVEMGPSLGVSPFPGKGAEASKAVRAAIGVALSDTGRFAEHGGVRVAWVEKDGWVVFAEREALGALADALNGLALCRWQDGSRAGLALTGDGARDVLARLTSLDLRPARFAEGAVAACEVAHMAGHVLRTQTGFEVWVPRSFASTLVKEVRHMADQVAARDERAGRKS